MQKAKWNHLISELKKRGYVMVNDIMYPPNAPEAIAYTSLPKKKNKRLEVIKTGWINDTRNIKNKEKYQDPFIQLIEMEFGLTVWPEFFFSTERLYRFDYCIPVDKNGKELKLAIECNGGIHMRGNSGHSSGKGIARDMEKSNLAQSLGWNLISVTPSQLMTNYTLELIYKIVKQ